MGKPAKSNILFLLIQHYYRANRKFYASTWYNIQTQSNYVANACDVVFWHRLFLVKANNNNNRFIRFYSLNRNLIGNYNWDQSKSIQRCRIVWSRFCLCVTKCQMFRTGLNKHCFRNHQYSPNEHFWNLSRRIALGIMNVFGVNWNSMQNAASGKVNIARDEHNWKHSSLVFWNEPRKGWTSCFHHFIDKVLGHFSFAHNRPPFFVNQANKSFSDFY